MKKERRRKKNYSEIQRELIKPVQNEQKWKTLWNIILYKANIKAFIASTMFHTISILRKKHFCIFYCNWSFSLFLLQCCCCWFFVCFNLRQAIALSNLWFLCIQWIQICHFLWIQLKIENIYVFGKSIFVRWLWNNQTTILYLRSREKGENENNENSVNSIFARQNHSTFR